MTIPTITVHALLAAAYGGNNPTNKAFARAVLHASTDRGETSLCKRVRPGNLCDQVEERPVSCVVCARRIRSLEKASRRA